MVMQLGWLLHGAQVQRVWEQGTWDRKFYKGQEVTKWYKMYGGRHGGQQDSFHSCYSK